MKLLNANKVNNLNTCALNDNVCERADATAEAAARYSRFRKLKLKVENITRVCLRGEASRARLAVV